jgi:hypothetical protein
MYTQTWNKYLPAIRILLKRSATSAQKMGLNRTDFERGNRKPSCSFNIELERGRFVTVSQSAPAKDLVAALLEDEISKGLLKQNHYHISLSSDFQLSIVNKQAVPGSANA